MGNLDHENLEYGQSSRLEWKFCKDNKTIYNILFLVISLSVMQHVDLINMAGTKIYNWSNQIAWRHPADGIQQLTIANDETLCTLYVMLSPTPPKGH